MIGAWFASNVPLAQKSFWTHPMELLGDLGHVESHIFYLETVLVSMKDRCTVCAKHTLGSKIILDAPDVTPRWRGSSESSVCWEMVLILTQDSYTVCVERTIGLEIILASLDGTPRWRGSCGISLFCLETVLVLVQDRFTFALDVP
jgi:hypothetical protein